MQEYTAGKTYGKHAAPKQEEALLDKPHTPNSALLSLLKQEEQPVEDADFSLDAAMNERLLGFRGKMQPQIPTAEHEADQLSASITAKDPEGVKTELGEKLGADFSAVRFHTDTAAQGYAEHIGARAYTSGQDVFFGEGGFDSGIAAHELVHTVQQGAVEASAETVSAPMGGVQMVPEFLHKAGRWLGHKIAKPAVGVNEFIGGKMGLVGAPNADEKAANAARARNGDLSMVARMSSSDKQASTDAAKQRLLTNLMTDSSATPQSIAAQYDTTRALNPFERGALSSMAKSKVTDYAPGTQSSQALLSTQLGKLSEAQELIDQQMMIDTIMGPSAQERQNVVDHYRRYDDQELLQREYDVAKSGKRYLGTEGGPDAYYDTQRMMRWRGMGRQRLQTEAQRLADTDLRHAQGSGDAMLNTMLLMQLGKFDKTTERLGPKRLIGKPKKIKEQSSWDKTMANAFSHGGRTSFTFGAGTGNASSDRITEQIFGQNAGLEDRAAATHHLTMPKAGDGTKGRKEGGGVFSGFMGSKLDRNFTHSGMNMAIGGIGKAGGAGPGGTGMMINVQGRNGHMYVGQAHSTADQKGGLLMGLESDSPYRMNQTGHMHNAAAKGEEGSSTGGLKTDLVGKKYGGRNVDLSGLQNEEVTALLQSFNAHIGALRSSQNPNSQAELLRLVTLLSGKQLSKNALISEVARFSQAGGMTQNENLARVAEMISRSRAGSDILEGKAKK